MTVGIVLREMLLVVLVATAQEGCIQRLSSGNRGEAIGGRQNGGPRLLTMLGVQPLIGAAAVRSASLPYGIAVVDRSRPQVSDQGETGAPGDGEDGTVSDRSPQQQPPQRVDDGREGLVGGEPAYHA